MTVPRRAFTWWCGPEPMTPLHQASMRSFKRWHPGWDVTVHWGEDGPDARRRSDVWRWAKLDEGGVWFDADVIWYGSIEPHLTGQDQITMDTGTPGLDGRLLSIGVCVGSVFGSYFGSLRQDAARALESDSDQSTGTELMAARPVPGYVTNLPGSLLYRVPTNHADMDSLWEPGADVPLDGIAMHWYGSRYKGDPHPDSPIGRALAKAFA